MPVVCLAGNKVTQAQLFSLFSFPYGKVTHSCFAKRWQGRLFLWGLFLPAADPVNNAPSRIPASVSLCLRASFGDRSIHLQGRWERRRINALQREALNSDWWEQVYKCPQIPLCCVHSKPWIPPRLLPGLSRNYLSCNCWFSSCLTSWLSQQCLLGLFTSQTSYLRSNPHLSSASGRTQTETLALALACSTGANQGFCPSKSPTSTENAGLPFT